MMWNWLVSSLAVGATVVLYDGAPFIRRRPILWDMCADERVTVFGTSAKWLALAEKEELAPDRDARPAARSRRSCRPAARSPTHSYDYVYRDVKPDVRLSSISGGTDIISCFALGNPIGPVWRGELQARGLGMKVEVFDDDGHSVVGQPGELVCTAPFPSMPVAFWNDPDGAKYRAAYFDRFPERVAPRRLGGDHGARRHDHLRPERRDAQPGRRAHRHGGDLPAGGAAAGGDREPGGRAGHCQVTPARTSASCCSCGSPTASTLTEALRDKIRAQIRANASPHHVPKKIIQVADIPRTISGKITELAVRDVVHGRPVKNVGRAREPRGARAVSRSAGAGRRRLVTT